MSRHSSHRSSNEFHSLKIGNFYRGGFISRADYAWKYGNDLQGRTQIEVHPSEAFADIIVTFSTYPTFRQIVDLVFTSPHYGGVRPWFACPECDKRVGVLFLPFHGRHTWACRHCWNLRYLSQRLTPWFRLSRRARQLAQHLSTRHLDDGEFPEKPKGMHWSTYYRLQGQWCAVIDQAEELFREELQKVSGRFRLG